MTLAENFNRTRYYGDLALLPRPARRHRLRGSKTSCLPTYMPTSRLISCSASGAVPRSLPDRRDQKRPVVDDHLQQLERRLHSQYRRHRPHRLRLGRRTRRICRRHGNLQPAFPRRLHPTAIAAKASATGITALALPYMAAMVRLATGGKLDILDHPVVENACAYAKNIMIDERVARPLPTAA